jgi:hypothetical protein
MNSKKSKLHRFPIVVLVVAAVAFVAGCSKKPDEGSAVEPQKTFSSPTEAGQALHAAVQAKDEQAITQVLGAKGKQLVDSGDSSEDRRANEAFGKKYEQMNRLVAMTDGSQMLYVGADNYPFPLPLAQNSSSRWYFDAAAGEKELAARNIGRHEMDAMDTIRLIANAEDLYHQKTHSYTDTLVSTPGKQDGLYWEASSGDKPSPLGTVSPMAKGVFAANAPSQTLVSHGYSFRVVAAKTGYTVFASPVNYQKSGIMTFSLGPDGVIYQQDLNPANAAAAIDQYKPSNGWEQAE